MPTVSGMPAKLDLDSLIIRPYTDLRAHTLTSVPAYIQRKGQRMSTSCWTAQYKLFSYA